MNGYARQCAQRLHLFGYLLCIDGLIAVADSNVWPERARRLLTRGVASFAGCLEKFTPKAVEFCVW